MSSLLEDKCKTVRKTFFLKNYFCDNFFRYTFDYFHAISKYQIKYLMIMVFRRLQIIRKILHSILGTIKGSVGDKGKRNNDVKVTLLYSPHSQTKQGDISMSMETKRLILNSFGHLS